VPPRRTQAERRERTRAALLDATVSSLVDLGFSGTTTTEVAHRAGVSLGALLHHFPSKADLLAAAVGHVLERRQAEFREAMTGVAPGVDRIDAAIDLLWSSFSGPTFTAWLELWVASRTDAELAREILAVATARGVTPESFDGFDPRAYLPDAPSGAAERSLDDLVAHNRKSAKTHSGIWRDLAVRRRQTEVDAQLGIVVTLAREVGVATPLTERLIELIHDIENGVRPQSLDTLDELGSDTNFIIRTRHPAV